MTSPEPILFCWSGGKDSAMALHTLLQQKQFRVAALLSENGEFHTFVFDGPIFRSPIPVRRGDVVNRDDFVFCDLLPQLEEATK